MTLPPPLRTPAVRLLLVAYPALAGILPATGRLWLTVPLCLTALAATGALWIRALPGLPAETGVPAARPGLAAAAGLITIPLLALVLHAAGHPVRPAPLVIACAALVTVLGAAAALRDHRAARRSTTRPGLPAQRRHKTSPPASSGSLFRYGRTSAPDLPDTDGRPTPSSQAPDPDLTADGAPAGADPEGSVASGEAAAASTSDESGSVPGRGDFAPNGPGSAFGAIGGGTLLDAELLGAGRGPVRTTVAVTIPLVLAVGVGGWAVHAYLTAPHPAEPGYLSIALNGWAAAVEGPVTVPARGLVVPVRVTSAGIAETTRLLQLRVGGRVVASRPMTVAADSVRSLTVYVPALPPDGRLRNVAISVGVTSIGFYARGHADTVLTPQTTAGAAVTGPGVGSHAPAGPGGTSGVPGAQSRPAGPASGAGVRSGGGDVHSGGGVPASSNGDRAGGVRASSNGDRAGGVRASSGGDRAGGVRAHSGGDRRGGVRAQPGGDRAPGVRPAPVRTGGVRTPSVVSSGTVTGPAGGAGPAGGTGPGTGRPDPAAPVRAGDGTAGAEDRTRSGGTKGGRAKTGPVPPPWTGPDGSMWPASPGDVVPDPSRVACSGKRRAVLAGEQTLC